MDTLQAPAPVEIEGLTVNFAWSPTIGKLAGALAKAQKLIGHARAEAENPHFKSTYADLSAVIDACRDPLADNDLARYQAPMSTKDGFVGVKTLLIHVSGEWIASILWCKPVGAATPQAIGSVITYLRRYGLSAAVGTAQKDDDAEEAQGRARIPTPPGLAAVEAAAGKKMMDDAADEVNRARERAKAERARQPGTCDVEAPPGEVPVFLFRNGAWDFVGGFAPEISKDHQKRVKILQKEAGIPEAIWAEKLVLSYGKTSSTQLSDAEALDLCGRLEALKKAKAG